MNKDGQDRYNANDAGNIKNWLAWFRIVDHFLVTGSPLRKGIRRAVALGGVAYLLHEPLHKNLAF